MQIKTTIGYHSVLTSAPKKPKPKQKLLILSTGQGMDKLGTLINCLQV